MNEIICTKTGTRDDVLLAYLYDESGPDERLAFERHLGACAACRLELEAFGGVRAALARWAPPDPPLAVGVPVPAVSPVKPRGFWGSLGDVPAWAQMAAAVVFLGTAAGLANLEVAYSAEGLAIHTGWRHVGPAVSSLPSPVRVGEPPATPASPPWDRDLAALRQELNSALSASSVSGRTPAAQDSGDAVLRRVRLLLQESEQRQQRELALRVAEVVRDVQSQRNADLIRIDRSLGLIQSRTGMEVMRTQQQVNSLAQRVSQQP